MDRDMYKSFSEMMRMSTFQMIIAVGAAYYSLLCKFTLDVNDAFQATRTDRPGEKQPPLTWVQRLRIIVGTARALAYLHPA